MVELVDIVAVGVVSLFMGVITSMSGLNLGRFTVVAHVESSVPTAVGTTIGITAMVTVSTVIAYIRAGLIHRKALLAMSSTGVIGCIIASYFTVLLPSLLVLAMIATSMVWSIYRLVRSKPAKQDPQISQEGQQQQQQLQLQQQQQTDTGLHLKQYLTGLIVGLLGGLMGVIFSSIILGSLVHVVRSDPKMLIGTTLAFSALLGICGVLAHLAHGNMNFILLGIMGSTGMIGGVIGSWFSTSMKSHKLRMTLISIQVGTLFYLAFMIVITILRPAVIHCNHCF